MRKINTQRAQLISGKYKKGDCSIVVTDIIKTFLSNVPSIIEKQNCFQKGCSKVKDFLSPYVCLNNEVFDNDLANISNSIIANFSTTNNCFRCRKPSGSINRSVGNHLFIEVFDRTNI